MPGGLMYDERFLNHRCSYNHPERPERLEATWSRLSASGIVAANALLEPRRATLDELFLVHDEDYVRDVLTKIHGSTGFLDGDTFFSPGTEEAALLAAGGTVDLARAVRRGDLDWGMSLPRPPGHHATQDRAMGFCIFNNIAAATAALLADGVERILIFDWDVHHGNGTQNIFYDNPQVLFISVHQWPHFPGSGSHREIGAGKGVGRTVNLPFPSGASNIDYATVMDTVVEPLAALFQPEMILVSAGFDTHEKDMLGGMRVTASGFAHMAARLREMAKKSGAGPCLVLEGGYHLEGLSQSIEAVVKALAGSAPPPIVGSPSRECLASIQSSLALIKPHWPGL